MAHMLHSFGDVGNDSLGSFGLVDEAKQKIEMRVFIPSASFLGGSVRHLEGRKDLINA